MTMSGLAQAGQKVGDWLFEHAWMDWALSLAVTGVNVGVAWTTGHGDALRSIGIERRLDFYDNGMVVVGILLTFAGTALIFYQAANGPRIQALRRKLGPRIGKQWIQACSGPAIALGVFAIATVFDQNRPGTERPAAAAGVRWLSEAAAILVAIRLWKLIAVLFPSIVGASAEDEAAARDQSGIARADLPVRTLRPRLSVGGQPGKGDAPTG